MTDTPLGSIANLSAALEALAKTVDTRKDANPSTSYTAKLLSKGTLHCGKKIAEEGAELALALAAEGKRESAAEAADLLYHILVGLRSKGVSLDRVAAALAKRQGLSGLEEKARRTER